MALSRRLRTGSGAWLRCHSGPEPSTSDGVWGLAEVPHWKGGHYFYFVDLLFASWAFFCFVGILFATLAFLSLRGFSFRSVGFLFASLAFSCFVGLLFLFRRWFLLENIRVLDKVNASMDPSRRLRTVGA